MLPLLPESIEGVRKTDDKIMYTGCNYVLQNVMDTLPCHFFFSLLTLWLVKPKGQPVFNKQLLCHSPRVTV